MSNDHQNICRTLKLVHYKANEKIVRQGEKGNAFYHILSGIVKIIVSKKIDLGLNKSSATENDVTVDVSITFITSLLEKLRRFKTWSRIRRISTYLWHSNICYNCRCYQLFFNQNRKE